MKDEHVNEIKGIVILAPFQVNVPEGVGERRMAWRFADSSAREP